MSDQGLVCTFHVEPYLLGVPAAQVQEVLREQPVTPVPRAHVAVRGMINLRGQIVHVVDLRTRLALGAGPERPGLLVLLRTMTEPVCLRVDRVGDVIDLTGVTLDPVPDTLRGSARQMVGGIHRVGERLLHVLDADRVATLDDD